MLAPLAALDHATGDPEVVGDAKERRVATRFRAFMEALGLDMEDPNLSGTEWRVARAFRELFAGLHAGAAPTLRTFPNTEGYSEIVAVTDVPFITSCRSTGPRISRTSRKSGSSASPSSLASWTSTRGDRSFKRG